MAPEHASPDQRALGRAGMGAFDDQPVVGFDDDPGHQPRHGTVVPPPTSPSAQTDDTMSPGTPEPAPFVPVSENPDIPTSEGGLQPEFLLSKLLQAVGLTGLYGKDRKVHNAYWQDVDNAQAMLAERDHQRQLEQEERDYVALLAKSEEEEVKLVKSKRRARVLFINSKGNGGTTTSTIWTATGLCKETGAEVTVFDGNWASGTAAQRLHFGASETITERLLVDNHAALAQNHGTYIEYVKPNTDRVRVIAAKSIMEGGGKLDAQQYRMVAELGFDNCEFLYIDSPNDIASEQLLMLAQLADVLVFTANVKEQDSLRQLGTSMQTLRNHGLADKVNEAVVLISNLPKGKTADDYRKYRHETNIHNKVVKRFPGHRGPWVGIRHSKAMANAQPVNWSALDRDTAQDIRLVNTAILGQLEDKSELSELDETTTLAQEPTAPVTNQAVSEEVRATDHFAQPSGHPPTPELALATRVIDQAIPSGTGWPITPPVPGTSGMNGWGPDTAPPPRQY